jgi:thiol:disulfide interchange protein
MVLLAMLLDAGPLWALTLLALHLGCYALASWREWPVLQKYLLAAWFGLFCGAMFFWDKHGGGQPAPEWLKLLAHWHAVGWIILVLLFLPLTLLERLAKKLRRRADRTQAAPMDSFTANLAQFDLQQSFARPEDRQKTVQTCTNGEDNSGFNLHGRRGVTPGDR